MLKLDENGSISFYGVFYIEFICFFFECDLFSLRNTCTKFREAACGGYSYVESG
jgi:hypothetical protein